MNFPLILRRNGLRKTVKKCKHLTIKTRKKCKPKIDHPKYLPNAVVNKTIMKKMTDNLTASSFDKGEELAENHLLSIILFKYLTVPLRF